MIAIVEANRSLPIIEPIMKIALQGCGSHLSSQYSVQSEELMQMRLELLRQEWLAGATMPDTQR